MRTRLGGVGEVGVMNGVREEGGANRGSGGILA